MARLVTTAAMLGAFALALYPAAAGELKKGKCKGRHNSEAIFKKLDANSDGNLSKEEFMKMADWIKARRGDKTGEKAVKFLPRMFERLDANKDGSLSLEEFKKLPEVRKELRAKCKQMHKTEE